MTQVTFHFLFSYQKKTSKASWLDPYELPCGNQLALCSLQLMLDWWLWLLSLSTHLLSPSGSSQLPYLRTKKLGDCKRPVDDLHKAVSFLPNVYPSHLLSLAIHSSKRLLKLPIDSVLTTWLLILKEHKKLGDCKRPLDDLHEAVPFLPNVYPSHLSTLSIHSSKRLLKLPIDSVLTTWLLILKEHKKLGDCKRPVDNLHEAVSFLPNVYPSHLSSLSIHSAKHLLKLPTDSTLTTWLLILKEHKKFGDCKRPVDDLHEAVPEYLILVVV